MDILTCILAILLATTLLAFMVGWFPYPFGWLIFGALLIARILHLRQRRRG